MTSNFRSEAVAIHEESDTFSYDSSNESEVNCLI